MERALPTTAGTHHKVDVLSVLQNAVAFAALVIGAELITEDVMLARAGLAFSMVTMVVLVRRELPRPSPLIPLDLLRSASFRVSVPASVCCFVGQSAAMIALPF